MLIISSCSSTLNNYDVNLLWLWANINETDTSNCLYTISYKSTAKYYITLLYQNVSKNTMDLIEAKKKLKISPHEVYYFELLLFSKYLYINY